MKINDIILEKVTTVNKLLIKIDKYWTSLEIVKSIVNYNFVELRVHVYTFLKDDEDRIAYIINKNINLIDSTAVTSLNILIEDLEKLGE